MKFTLSSLKLAHKGLLLLSVPLVFEVAFIIAVSLLFNQAQEELAREARFRDLLTHVNVVMRSWITAATSMMQYDLSHDPQLRRSFYTQAQLLRHELDLSYQLAGNDTADRKALDNGGPLALEGLQVLTGLIDNIDKGGTALLNPHEIARAKRISMNLQENLGVFDRRLTDEIDAQHKLFEQTSAKLKIALIGALITLFLLALYLNFVINRTTAKRLAVLMDNTKLLAAGKPLNPPLAGSDEIAELDQVFASMAHALHEASEKQREVEKLKQEFVALISHDLRTPLTSVGGILELMSRGAYGETSTTAQTQIGVARRNLDRVLGLINQLLDMEKLESGTIALDIKDVSIKSVLQRALESVSAFADQHQVEIEIAAEDVFVIADAERIVQVVVNLLSNAVKFSPPGAKVSVCVSNTAGPPPAVEVSVKDGGPGVAAEAHELIFQKFRQSGAIATDREKGGTGLGLAICKAIVELHGGQIGVDSTPGSGARFWFTLQPTSIAMTPDVDDDSSSISG